MAFVNEKITREEDINLFNSFHLKDPITKVIANPKYRDWETDRKSTRLNSSHRSLSRMPSSA